MTEVKRKGRPPLTEEQKAERKKEREAKKLAASKSSASKSTSQKNTSTNKSVEKVESTQNDTASNKVESLEQKDVSEMNSFEKLAYVHQLLESTTSGVVVMEDGKTYTKVSERVKRVREVFGFDLKIVSNVVDFDNQKVRVEAQIWIKENGVWDMIQTANAFEEKNASFYNKTSYVEVAETSAIGRALGFLGLFGDEFASIDEIGASLSKGEGNTNKQTSGVMKANKQNSSSIDKRASSEQINFLKDFLDSNKNYTMPDLLANVKATKLEELGFNDANSIINLIKLNDMDESPL